MKFFATVIILGLFSFSAFSQWTRMNGPAGGYVGDIVTINNYILINAYAGGVYRSENNVYQWNPVNNGLPKSPHCWALTVTGNTVYASIGSHGVYKSTDFGMTWSSTGAALQGKTFYSLLADGDDIYAGEQGGGFYHSGDGGGTWVKRGGDEIGQVNNFVVTGGVLFVAASGRGPSTVHKSANKGETLTKVNVPLTNIYHMGGYDNAIYLSGIGVAISRDFGVTWSTSPIRPWESPVYAHDDLVILGGGNSTVFISQNEGVDWITTTTLPFTGVSFSVNRNGNTIIVGGLEGIYISENNGISWQEKNEGLNNVIITHLAATDDILFAGTREGLFLSTNQGITWTKRNNGLENTSDNSVVEGIGIMGIHIGPTNTVVATNRGIFKTVDNGLNWDLKQQTTNFLFNVLTGDQEKIFACEEGYQYYSSNDGEDWSSRSDPAFERRSFSNAKVKGDTIVALAPDKVLISKDFGLTWQNIVVTPGPYFAPTDALFIENDLYLASYQGIFKSEDLGATWKKLNDMTDRSPLSLFYKGNVLYAGTTVGVHVSFDNGVTWHVLNEGMEDIWTGPLVFNSTYAFSATWGMSVWRNKYDDLNVRPVITGFQTPLELNSALNIPIELENLLVTDPDDDFPQEFSLVVNPGANYTVTNNGVTPADDYNGELHIALVVNDGHSDSKEYVATIYVITGVEESLASFKIFPNPTTQKINFTMTERVKSISLRDLAGREIARFENIKAIDETSSIDVSHLAKGVYFIEVIGKEKHIQRFLKY